MYLDNEKKFTAVVKRDLSKSQMLNALAHAVTGLMRQSVVEGDGRFSRYVDALGRELPFISTYPWVILEAKRASDLSRLWDSAIQDGQIAVNAFFDTMWGSSEEEQIAATAKAGEDNLCLVVLFGTSESLRPLTRKFSVLKDAAPP